MGLGPGQSLGNHMQADAFLRRRVLPGKAWNHRVARGRRLLQAHSRLKEPQHVQTAMVPPRPETVIVAPQPSHAQRDVGLHVNQGTQAVKTFRRHAHDGHTAAIQLYLPADDAGVTVALLFPVSVAQHDHRVTAWPFRRLAVTEPPGCRSQSQRLKKIPAYFADHHWLGSARQFPTPGWEAISQPLRQDSGIYAHRAA